MHIHTHTKETKLFTHLDQRETITFLSWNQYIIDWPSRQWPLLAILSILEGSLIGQYGMPGGLYQSCPPFLVQSLTVAILPPAIVMPDEILFGVPALSMDALLDFDYDFEQVNLTPGCPLLRQILQCSRTHNLTESISTLQTLWDFIQWLCTFWPLRCWALQPKNQALPSSSCPTLLQIPPSELDYRKNTVHLPVLLQINAIPKYTHLNARVNSIHMALIFPSVVQKEQVNHHCIFAIWYSMEWCRTLCSHL